MRGKKINGWSIVTQVVLWSLMWCIPFISVSLNGGTWENLLWCLKDTHFSYLSWMLLFYLNYFLLIPRYLFRHKSWHYFVANFLLTIVLQHLTHYYLLWINVEVPVLDAGTRVAMSLGGAVLNIFLILASISLKVQERNSRLEVEAATHELERLKSQLNPHFLFNTLNNISSLVAIEPDAAQTSISRLSDMLRYVLYDSTRPTVPLKDEMKFLRDYIDLMRLRYADTLRMETSFNVGTHPGASYDRTNCEGGSKSQLRLLSPDKRDCSPPTNGGARRGCQEGVDLGASLQSNHISVPLPDRDVLVPPLLYITLVENAFKHGASSRHDCFIHISLAEEEGWLCFTVDNSLLHDNERPSGKSGGVGLKNLEQRLRLLYKEGDYRLHTSQDADAYHAELKIRI